MLNQMKLLFMEPVSFSNHYNYNFGILRNMPEYVRIDICAAKNYIKKGVIRYKNYYEIPDSCIYTYDSHRKFNQLYLRRKILSALLWAKSRIHFEKYDVILFGYTESITFYFVCRHLPGKVLYIDHEIGATVKSKVKRWFIRRVNERYELIVFEEYIKAFLERHAKLTQPVRIVHHPLPQIRQRAPVKENMQSRDTLLFGPAYSNDESFAEYIFKNRSRLPKDCRIVLKSRNISYEGRNLKLFTGRITDDEYRSGMEECSAVLLPYGKDYNFRTSGVFYEAVQNKKPVILFADNTMKYYAGKYRNIIYPFYSYPEFMKKLPEICAFADQVTASDFADVLLDYSDEIIRKELKEILES